MLPYHDAFAKQQKIRHQHLAQQQHTRVAVLPVHTPSERALYRLLVKQPNGLFSGKTQPNWVTVAVEWSRHCDGIHIFYKLPEQLKNYFKTWSTNRNEANSLELNKDAFQRIHGLLPHPDHLPQIPTRQQETLDQEINTSHCIPQEPEATPWHVGILLSKQSAQQSAIQFYYGDRAPPVASGSRKRKQTEESNERPVKKRKPRTCQSCHKPDCPGAFMGRPCAYTKVSTRQ